MSTPVRWLALALMSLLALSVLALGPRTAPAGAFLVEAEEGAVKVGAQPRSEELLDGTHGVSSLGVPIENLYAFDFGNPEGAPVLPSSHTYAIYWDPTDNYHSDWQELIDTFFQNMGAASGSLGSVFAVDAQYTDKAGQHASYKNTFMGAYVDSEPYPEEICTDPAPLKGITKPSDKPAAITCITDAQIQAQLKTFITGHELQTGMGSIFYVLTPPGVTVCLDKGGKEGHCSDFAATAKSYENSFCSYHGAVSPTNPESGDANTILYAVIPWTAGGYADHHLPATAQTPAYDCQDGGYDPSSKPDIEEREKKQEKTKQQEEQEAKTEKTAKEKEAQELKEILEGPHEEEPNQPTTNGPDGFPDTGLADLIINQIAVEQQNIVTDPLLNAWHDPSGKESTDECRDFFAAGGEGGSVTASEYTGAGTLFNQTLNGGQYYLNDAFDLAALELPYPGVSCLGGISLAPQFTAPNPVAAGELVAFNGMESNITLNWGTEYSAIAEALPTYALYRWNFGDGTPEVSGYAPGSADRNPPASLCDGPWKAPCASSVFHSYQYGGTYEVTLTVTDTGGDTTSVTHQVAVVGPAPPPPAPPTPPAPPAPAAAPAAQGAASGSGSSGSGATSTTTLPGPVASAAAVASSVKQVSRGGLVVHYKVNEQVAGRFEVLLAAATAHSLGIGGHVASELPAGSPKSLVIGQALLVTTKGGHSTVRIKFCKRVAKHLRRAKRVTLMLRLRVRNAAKSPVFTTVFSTVDLHG
jgi:PKD domain